uniref:MD-2-related lipid-recognition domain-containing protein n=1 Tax=Megaselia scalaris TaxID=36166 RepID=T1GX03_MEGSC
MDYAYCPLDPTEDVTYLFKFFIMETYPEIPVKIEIYLVNQDKDIVTCFTCPIKVVSGNAAGETVNIFILAENFFHLDVALRCDFRTQLLLDAKIAPCKV